MKKRWIPLVLAVLLLAVTLTGCTSSAEGLYVLKTINGMDARTYVAHSLNRTELSDREINAVLQQYGIRSLEEMVTIELRADQTAVLNAANGMHREGKWKQYGRDLTIGNGKAEYQEGEFTLQLENGMSAVMIRKDLWDSADASSVSLDASHGFEPAAGVTMSIRKKDKSGNAVEGSYRLKSINGGDILDYYDEMGEKAGLDGAEVLALFGVADPDELPTGLGFTLRPNGTALYGHLSEHGLEYLEGDWIKFGDKYILTIYDAQKCITYGPNGMDVEYDNKVLCCTFADGEFTATEEHDGSLWVYAREENKPQAEWIIVGEEINVETSEEGKDAA